MKKKFIPVALVATLCGSMLFSSCIGSFALTNKLLAWNKTVGGKVVNELVFIGFCIIPVYGVSALADLLVINSIEFWSGENPMACGKKIIDGQDGRYIVECDGKGYTITSENDGTAVRLDFNVDTQTWAVAMPDGECYDFLTFVDETHVALPAADGSVMVCDLTNPDGSLMAYRQQADAMHWAAR